MREIFRIVPAMCLAISAATRGGEAPPERDPPKPRGEDVPSVQRYCLAELKRAEGFAEGSGDRKRLLGALIVYMNEQRAFSADRGLDGFVLWFRYVLGRARALDGDTDGACRELDAVIGFATKPVSGDARKYVDELRLNAFHLKVKTVFAAGDYETCVRVADNMLAPVTGYTWALSDDRGNAVAIYRAKAFLLKKRPNVARAVEQCMRVIREAHGDWRNNARELLYEVHSKRLFPFLSGLVPPAILREVARGAYLVALDAAEEGERQRLLDEAVAIYRTIILACRKRGVDVCLEHEPRALIEMGVVYSSHELWYESMFCFEEVIFRFSREGVGRLLAGDARFDEAWRAHREAFRDVTAADLHRGFYWEMMEDSPLSAQLRRHESRLAMSARNLRTATRGRWRESRSDFDGGLIRRAAGMLAKLDADLERRPPPKARGSPGDALTDDDDMVF